MNPETPTPREQLEARLTALLLGELPADESAALREQISQDADLRALHARLEQTIGLVRETAADPVEQTAEQPAPLRLSEERREKLLAQFKTVAPREFAKPKRNYREWLVPAAAAAALVILGTLFLPVLATTKRKSQTLALSAAAEMAGLKENGESFTQYPALTNGAFSGHSMPVATPAPNPNQPYSANVVGYVNMKPTSNQVALLEDSLDGVVATSRSETDSTLNSLLQSRDAAVVPVRTLNNIVLPSTTELADAGNGWKDAGGNPPSQYRFYLDLNRAQGEKPGGFVTGTTRDDVGSMQFANGFVNGGAAVATSQSSASAATGSGPGPTLGPLTIMAYNDQKIAVDEKGKAATNFKDVSGLAWQTNALANQDYDYFHWGQDSAPSRTIVSKNSWQVPVSTNGRAGGEANQLAWTNYGVLGGQFDDAAKSPYGNAGELSGVRAAGSRGGGGGGGRGGADLTTQSGYVDTSFQWNLGTGNANVPGYSFNSPTKSDGFNLDAVLIRASKSLDASGQIFQVSTNYQPVNGTLRGFYDDNNNVADAKPLNGGSGGAIVAGVAAAPGGGGSLQTRTFRVDPNTFVPALQNANGTTSGGGGGFGGGGGGGGGIGGSLSGGGGLAYVTSQPATANVQSAVRDYFGQAGLDLSTNAGKAVIFNDRKGTLTVRATSQDLDLIEAAIQTLNTSAPEINVKAKFAEITPNDQRAVGFNWNVGGNKIGGAVVGSGGTQPSLNGPLNNDGFTTFPGATNAFYGTSTLIAPAVTDGSITQGLRNQPLTSPVIGTLAATTADAAEVAIDPATGLPITQSAKGVDWSGTLQAQALRNQPNAPAGTMQNVGHITTVTTTGSAAAGASIASFTPLPPSLSSDRDGAGKPPVYDGRNGVLTVDGGNPVPITTTTINNGGSVTFGNNFGLAAQGTVKGMGGVATQLSPNSPKPVLGDAPSLGYLFNSAARGSTTISETAASERPKSQVVLPGNENGQVTANWRTSDGTTREAEQLALNDQTAVRDSVRRQADVVRASDFPGRLVVTNGSVQMAQNGQSAGTVHFIPLKNAEPQDVQQILKELFPDGSAANQATSVQNNPLLQRAQTVQQYKEAPPAQPRGGGGSTMSSTHGYPNSTMNGPVSTSVDPETGKLIVITDDKTYASVANLVAQLDSTNRSALHVTVIPKPASVKVEDRPEPRVVAPPLIPQPEVLVRENAFSTFSLNVSDVSFKLAGASLDKGLMPDPGTVRSEEFINAFDYRDPEPPPGAPIGFAFERARYPFAHNRDLLRFALKTAAAGRQPGRPLNIVLLLDNSGSMERADRVAIIREALRVLASQLQPQDKLSVVTFARTARLWVDGITGGEAAAALAKVSELTPEGGTNLEEAMRLAYETALRHYLANGMNRVVLLTDGAANLGNVDPAMLKREVELHRQQGVALDCFGIGWEGYNDDLLETLSRNGDGRYGFINTPEEAATGFAAQLAGALNVAASDVKVQVEFNPKRAVAYRQIGYAKHQLTKEQFRDNTVDAAEIAAAESGNALYTVDVNPQGEGPVCTVRVRYKVPNTHDYREQAWDVPYNGAAVALGQASPAMRLAATASAFSEWLSASPFAAEVEPDRLLALLNGVPEIYGADARPKKLEAMIRQAKAISGK